MRMRQDPGGKPDVGDGGHFPPRIYVGANGEAWRDEQLGQTFRDMRLRMKVSRETIARRLATSPSTVDNFEAGAPASPPPRQGKETNPRRPFRPLRGRPEAPPLAPPGP